MTRFLYRSLLIVDDFYADPLKVRQAALALDYRPAEGQPPFPAATRPVPSARRSTTAS